MQGVFYKGTRLPTKKALKEALTDHPEKVTLEATSAFGNEYGGPVLEMPENDPAYVVGPDPHTARNWYATVQRRGEKVKVS